MHLRTRGTALATVGLAAASLLGPPATAHASTGPTTVVARVSASSVHLSDDTLHAGPVVFVVRTKDRGHTLQIARLRHGYTLDQLGADLPKTFGGDVDAINRVDDGVSFRGGALGRPGKPGRFAVTLRAGHYIVVDQDGDGMSPLTVTGPHPRRAAVAHHGSVTAFSFGFGTAGSLPADGWVKVADQADQPHFVEFQHVAAGTTKRQVRAVLNPDFHGEPSWLRHGRTSTGVLSPGAGQVMQLDLPAGRYLVVCWWPDDKTGMPHAYMGMWKLVTLH
jgi:hypothetical protein